MVHELTCHRKNIRSFLVNPYKTKNLDVNQEHIKHLFTDSIIPKDLKNVDVYSAIPQRNRLIVDKSDYIISFVINNSGGAFKTLEYAKSQNHAEIISLSEDISSKFAIGIKGKEQLIFVGACEGDNTAKSSGFHYSSTPLTQEKIEEFLNEEKYSFPIYVLPFFKAANRLEYRMSTDEITNLIKETRNYMEKQKVLRDILNSPIFSVEQKLKKLTSYVKIYTIIIIILFLTVIKFFWL